MARYFMELGYKGTNYHGWQRQPNGTSVQQELENALSTILRIPTSITGAGRTDACVHAKYMVAHFDVENPLPDPQKLSGQLNRFLPRDIVVYSIVPVKSDAHSRFNAIARRYEYQITLHKNPFFQNLATRIAFQPDFDRMNEAAQKLIAYTDFTSFSKLHSNNKTNLCQIEFAFWEKQGEVHVFHIQADRFLRNMVRAIVGTLLEVGRGKMSVEDFCAVIEAKDRGRAGTSAPADGLYLVDVIYPENILPSRARTER
ncbi:tRNA pseudouridine(38-40) synthase TruA [Geofilum rubicundum]|uniref:tRNA pseudouridine synthase A n=1 Tax=Geofilum rubicundum JCM 15548 TaxID=1236989 RepID=A0A0E9LTV4_9BACT|nr:tRNA pseudouridine(38-40) synthase TruA [Geofilum rubicundum]GAO28689.1 tRNA pseudouridine synthase A [Geofilum rubicundum JCM 15548]